MRLRQLLVRMVGTTVFALPLAMESAEAQYTTTQCASITANALSNPAKRDTLDMLVGCSGAFSPTMTTLLARYSLVSDTNTYLNVYERASTRKEAAILAKAHDIAVDGSAPRLARLTALALILRYEIGLTRFDFRAVLNYWGDPAACSVSGGPGSAAAGETGLPADHKEAAYATATAITTGSNAIPVKFLAYCLKHATFPYRTSSATEVVDPTFSFPSDFAYSILCGRKVLIRNKAYGYVAIELRWTMATPGWNERIFTMPPRAVGDAYSEAEWTVPDNGTSAGVRYRGSTPVTFTLNSTPC